MMSINTTQSELINKIVNTIEVDVRDLLDTPKSDGTEVVFQNFKSVIKIKIEE